MTAPFSNPLSTKSLAADSLKIPSCLSLATNASLLAYVPVISAGFDLLGSNLEAGL